ncbi:Retinitis pigmentosa 1-like 1 protein [Galemys pyrenaicus]|uniref:Retinitis pigmentosa 1-like 1 protein n=1 Tax=Galemys pyrenaicus TaxID=202257 RepID=A0A8J5ZTF6_GALPY|nr:Retinitis pigmentosa 1-like 1 protein [Galemys pyrenaicus]
MNTVPRDAQALSHRGSLRPSAAQTPSITQVPAAKKITFLKRGDPGFAGVRLAVHQRAFKSLGALMDELSQRVPLSFGVRCVTAPRGLHALGALEQLEDGGCYICSDRNPVGTPRAPGPGEAPGAASPCWGPRAPRTVLLVKDGDPRLQRSAPSRRTAGPLAASLGQASARLRCPVRQLCTARAEKVGAA